MDICFLGFRIVDQSIYAQRSDKQKLRCGFRKRKGNARQGHRQQASSCPGQGVGHVIALLRGGAGGHDFFCCCGLGR